MRTNSEHVSGYIRRAAKRLKRAARAAMGRVRRVLKRVRGGVGIPRQPAEVRLCASVALARCTSGEAARGLPGGKRLTSMRLRARRGGLSFPMKTIAGLPERDRSSARTSGCLRAAAYMPVIGRSKGS